MVKVIEQTRLADSVLQNAAAWYEQDPHWVPEPFRKFPPVLRRAALKIAEGDWERCEALETAILVHNRPVWTHRDGRRIR